MDQTVGQTCYVPFLREGEGNAIGRQRKLHWTRRYQSGLLLGLGMTVAVIVACFIVVMHLWSNGTSTGMPLASVNNALLASGLERPAAIELWTTNDFSSEFKSFVSSYRKVYGDDEEEAHRYSIFRNNLIYIHMHNQQDYSFTLKMNSFGDMTKHEFGSIYANLKRSSNNTTKREIDWSLAATDENDLPSSLDWREKGCVTEVKNQQQCGSCWAFSTTGAVEGAVCKSTGKLPNLSEQQLVDCAGPEGNLGCDGGEYDWAFQYISYNKGLCSEKGYPYKATPSGFCNARQCNNSANISGFRDVPPKNELALRAAVVKYGPVSISIEADQTAFQFYEKGVFSAPCGTQLDHATLVVGYGTDTRTGHDYFIMKNSWGEDWGEGGYMKLRSRRGSNGRGDGECGFLDTPSYAFL